MSNSHRLRERIHGCFLGGAIGDALGAPIEFWSGQQIGEAFGAAGIRDYHRVRFGSVSGRGLITDDTQMTLFTAEGLIRAQIRYTAKGICHPPGVVDHAYQRWLTTQELPGPPVTDDSNDPTLVDGWLGHEQWLYSQRAPGNTCLSALRARRGSPYGSPADNTSKGCGAVMRSAPFGLMRLNDPPGMAVECAALTHGHPTGQLASGALAIIIQALADDVDLANAVAASREWLATMERHQETSQALQTAVEAARAGEPSFAAVQALGEGWVAEEALAIGVYAALVYPEPEQFRDALSLAVSHRGDSDSTGSICGNILGTLHAAEALPDDLLGSLEGRTAIQSLADDLATIAENPEQVRVIPDGGGFPEMDPRWWDRYPGW
jgi:ADP-ribosylglycohydrolase